MPRRQLRIGGDPAFLLCAREDALTVGVPTVVELALVLVRPFLGRVVRAVDRGGRPVHEQRLVRLQSLLPAHPGDRVVRQIILEVVALLRRPRRLHVVQVSNQGRLPARRLRSEKAVEVLEADARRPVLERADRGRLLGRRVVPLPPRTGRIPVVLQHVRHQRAALGNPPVIAIPVIRKLRDDPVPRPVVVAPGQQRGSSRRAHRRGVEPVVGDPLPDDAIHRRCVDLAAERGRVAGAAVVDHHDQNVRSVLRKPARCHTRLVGRLLHRPAGNTCRRRRWERKRLLLLHPALYPLTCVRVAEPRPHDGEAHHPGGRKSEDKRVRKRPDQCDGNARPHASKAETAILCPRRRAAP